VHAGHRRLVVCQFVGQTHGQLTPLLPRCMQVFNAFSWLKALIFGVWVLRVLAQKTLKGFFGLKPLNPF
jgi:hypothetical protein